MLGLRISSPATVIEGKSYSVRLSVTNQSTRAGLPVEATLGVGISAATEWTGLIPIQVSSEYFAPGETRTFDYTMAVPVGAGGETGQITAWVEDPTGLAIASATEDVVIAPAEVLANLYGVVTDAATGEPLEGAHVEVRPEGVDFPWFTDTDMTGYYSIQDIPIGTHDLECAHTVYETLKRKVTLQAGDNQLNIALSKPLPPEVRITDIYYILHRWEVWWYRDTEPIIWERDSWVVAFEVHCRNDSPISAEVRVRVNGRFISGVGFSTPEQIVTIAPGQTAVTRHPIGGSSAPAEFWTIEIRLFDNRTGALLDMKYSGRDWRVPWLSYKSRVEKVDRELLHPEYIDELPPPWWWPG